MFILDIFHIFQQRTIKNNVELSRVDKILKLFGWFYFNITTLERPQNPVNNIIIN